MAWLQAAGGISRRLAEADCYLQSIALRSKLFLSKYITLAIAD